MTIMADKLKEAGVKVPSVQERVWRIVRDNPGGIVASRVADILDPSGGRLANSASTLLSQMEARKMVSSRVEHRRVPGPRGIMIERGVKVYTTSLREYEILPMPRKETAATRAMNVVHEVVQQAKAPTTVMPMKAPPTINGVDAFIEQMTIAEARALWAALNVMFGGK